MCLVLLALDAHPRYPLIVAANRDERHGRPAQPLHWWSERPEIAGGRDLEAGGTWMGVRADLRFGAVLNDPTVAAPAGAPSRGGLVPAFLSGADAADAISRIHNAAGDYAGFHLVGGEPGRVWSTGRNVAQPLALGAGIHGLDNHGLDSSSPRLRRARAQFGAAIARSPTVAALLRSLADGGEPGPGAGDTRPVFITGERFGTRCSTVMMVDAEGGGQLVERRFDASGSCLEERRLEWACALALG